MMNPNTRSNLRTSSTFPRLGSSHQNRHGHHSRWHVTNIPFSKDFPPGYSQGNINDRDKDMFGFPKPPGVPSPSSYNPVAGHCQLEGAAAQLPPPHVIPQRSQAPDNPPPMMSISNNGPIINLNPSLLAPIENTDFQQRTNASLPPPDVRHNAIPTSTNSFYRPVGPEDVRKEMCTQSESPSRKRRRIVQSAPGHSGMPLPAHHQSPWEPRRNQRPPPRNSVPLRRSSRYSREWAQENHTLPRIQHPPAFPPPHPSTSHHPAHPTPIVMDLSQVPVSLPLPLYSSGPTPPTHMPPCQVHSIYCSTSPQQHPCPALNCFGGSMSHHTAGNHHHHHHHTNSMLFPSLAHIHYSAHIAPRHDPIEIDIIMDHHHRPPAHQTTILQVPTPSSIFISEVPRRTSGRRWSRPFQPAPSPFPGWLHILAMFSNPSLSPYGQDVSEVHHQSENYEEFLNIADRLGDAKPRGLTKGEIDQLPSFKYDPEDGEEDKTSCVICLCDFEGRQVLRALPCSHQFHAKCIDKWLKTNSTCPICRGDTSAYVLRTE